MAIAYSMLQKEDMHGCSQPSRNLVVAPRVDETSADSAEYQQSSLTKGGQRAGKAGYQPRHAIGKSPPQRAADPTHNLRSTAAVQRTTDDELRQNQLAGLNALLMLSCQTGPIPAIPASSIAPGPRTRILGLLREPALRGALALMASAIMAGVLGFAFWTLTARHHSASVLGSISAEVSSIAFLAIVGSLNLSSIFARFIPVAGWHARRFILISYGGAALAGLLAAVIFLVTPFAKELIIGGVLGKISFTLCVIINSVFNIQDGGLIGFARFTLVPVENVLVALSRLALLPLTAMFLSVPTGIFLSWALPMVVAVLAVNILIVGPLARRQANQRPSLPPFRELGRLISITSVTTAAYAAVGIFLPALVTHRLGATEGGYFYVPWVFTTMTGLLLTNISISMVREAVAHPEKAEVTIRRSMGLALLVVIIVAAVCSLMPRMILSVLGPSFAVHGAPILRWVGLATPATAVIVLFWSVCLVRRHAWPVLVINLSMSAAILGGVLMLGRGAEIESVGIIYCIVQWTAAAAVFIPTARSLRVVRSGDWSSAP
jgi:O-antigen/teichoic acid export membrane protein